MKRRIKNRIKLIKVPEINNTIKYNCTKMKLKITTIKLKNIITKQ